MTANGQSPQEHLREVFGQPLGWTKNGRPIWPIAGGAPDEDPAGSGGAAGDDGDGDPAGSGGEGGTGSSSEDDNRDPKAKITALEEEKNRHFKKFEAEKTRADELAAELQKIKDEKLSDDERIVKERDTLKQEVEVLGTAVNDLRVENAFLVDNTYTWHNAKRALKLVDLSEVKIKDDGSVEGLKDALEKLAKSDPYLIKTDTTDDGKGKPPAAGTTQNGSKGKGKGEPDREALLRKYPGLRR